MRRYFVAFGSNQQNPIAQLRTARQALRAHLHEQRASSLYQSPAWGYEEQPDFVNAVVEYQSALSPDEVLTVLQKQELAQGRVRSFQNAPRTLDLDLLLCDDLTLNSERLILPHPRMFERAFVIYPLLEIAPDDVFSGRPLAEHSLVNNLRRLTETW